MYISDLTALPETEKIAIIGLGRENRQFLKWITSVANFPTRRIIIADTANASTTVTEICTSFEGEEYYGNSYLDVCTREDVGHIFKAPGIWSDLPELQACRKRGVKVHSSLTFFLSHFKKNIIGITGTKGKSTTSAMIAHCINSHPGLTAHYCGNTTNISPYSFWNEITFTPQNTERFVIELSSFQLQDLHADTTSPHTSVITNYYVDHQDQHASIAEYWHAKDSIFQYQGSDDMVFISDQVESVSKTIQNYAHTTISTKSKAFQLIETEDLPFTGMHNTYNASLAVSAVSHATDISIQKATSYLHSFVSLPHRQQLLGSLDFFVNNKEIHISFYDDGYATELDAVAACLNTISSGENVFILPLFAGVYKGGDTSNLEKSIAYLDDNSKCIGACFSGQAGKEIQALCKNTIVSISNEPLKKIFEKFVSRESLAHWLSPFVATLPNNASLNIVLTPGGSSFDEFKNATERAEIWSQSIHSLLQSS